jgi:8-oxo-dGTP pyrophosphatase MutT (NUDIX family)
MTPAQQYAALPWRRAAELEILLITSRETKRWVIPKGWPMDGRTDAESAAQEAYEEAGIRGHMTDTAIGFYEYEKRGQGRGRKRLRVDVFAMEVTEVLDLWPEAHQRRRRWLSPQQAAGLVDEPKLAALIRGFAGDQSERALPAPTYLQAAWRQVRAWLRRVGAR